MDIFTNPVFLVALISGLILFQVHRHNAYRSACERFRNVVLKEFEGMYPIPSNWPANDFQLNKVLTDKFDILQTAITEFRHYVPWHKVKSFDRAWYRYYNAYADEPAYENPGFTKQAYHHYFDVGNYPNHKETFKHNVFALLKYAE